MATASALSRSGASTEPRYSPRLRMMWFRASREAEPPWSPGRIRPNTTRETELRCSIIKARAGPRPCGLCGSRQSRWQLVRAAPTRFDDAGSVPQALMRRPSAHGAAAMVFERLRCAPDATKWRAFFKQSAAAVATIREGPSAQLCVGQFLYKVPSSNLGTVIFWTTERPLRSERRFVRVDLCQPARQLDASRLSSCLTLVSTVAFKPSSRN
jgi:hypothetical protein